MLVVKTKLTFQAMGTFPLLLFAREYSGNKVLYIAQAFIDHKTAVTFGMLEYPLMHLDCLQSYGLNTFFHSPNSVENEE